MRSRTALSIGLAVLLAGLCSAPMRSNDKEKARTDHDEGPLPEGALVRLGTVRLRSTTWLTCLTFAPDGKSLVTASLSNRLQFWDTATGKQTKTWTVGTSSVQGLQFSEDGEALAVASSDGTIRILDGTTGVERRILVDPQPHQGTLAVLLSPDGKTALALHQQDRQLVIWDVEKNAVKHRLFDAVTSSPAAFAFFPDSQSFLGVWADNQLRVVDVATGKPRAANLPLISPPGVIRSGATSLALLPDGKTIVYRAPLDSRLLVADLATGKVVNRIAVRTYASTSALTVTPNGRFVIEGGGDVALRVYGVASGKLLRELISPYGGLSSMAMSRDGKKVASTSGNAIYLWDVSTGQRLDVGHGHHASVNRVALSGDGKYLVSGGGQTLRVWDLATGQQAHQTGRVYSYSMSHLHLSEDGKVARWVGGDRAVYQWKVGVDRAPVKVTLPRPSGDYALQAVSSDGKWLAGVSPRTSKVELIDLLGSAPDRELGTVANANQVAFSASGGRLAVRAADRSLTIYDVPTRRLVRKIEGQAGPDTNPALHFSPDGRSLLSFHRGLQLIEVLTGEVRLTLSPAPSGWWSQQNWSVDGRLLAWAPGDGSVAVYDTWTGRELMRRKGGQGNLYGLAFSKDGRKLATGGADTTVLVWAVPALPRLAVAEALDEKAAWRDLEDEDAGRAYRAMTSLCASPGATLKLFALRLRPRPPADARQVVRLIKDLDDDKYLVRERASDDLEGLGAVAREALKKATQSGSPEGRRRAEWLLRKLEGEPSVSPERLRAFRAVEVLERIGTPAARDVLKGLLAQKMEKALEASIKESLARMEAGAKGP